jgi:hypothetical protein
MERWFLSRGSPHVIAGYSATDDVFTRVAPLLTLVFLFSVFGAVNLDWGLAANISAVAGGFAVLLGSFAALNRWRRRPALQRPDTVGPVELGLFLVVPGALQAVFGGHVRAAITTSAALAVLLVAIYVVTSYGLVPLTRWAIVQTARELGAVAGLVVRALPLLLLFTAFLFLNAEMWQVSAELTGAALLAVVVLFVLLGTVFLLTRLPRELSAMAERPTRLDLLEGTPAEGADLPDTGPPLGRRERLNVMVVLLYSQAIQIAIVSVLVFGFFVVFGLIVIAPGVIETWTGDGGDVLADAVLFGRPTVLTAELFKVSAFLGAFSGLYFTVYAVTDATYREEFFEDLLDEVRRTLAVRAVYRAEQALATAH